MSCLRDKFEKIIQEEAKELIGYDVLISHFADRLLAAVCASQGHKRPLIYSWDGSLHRRIREGNCEICGIEP